MEQMNAGIKLARAYVPFQMYRDRFDPDEGLTKGTIFPELYSVYEKSDR
ncbi:MAG: spore coat associated protein CotJA [Bacillota bacterium]